MARPGTAHRLPAESGDAVAVALHKVSLALRSDAWDRAAHQRLNPTQAEVLVLLSRHRDGLRIGRIAQELGVTTATISDSITALARKGLVGKERAPDDARAVVVRLTAAGVEDAQALGSWPDAILAVLDTLDERDRGDLLRVLSRVIVGLQDAGAITTTRMCTTCRFFEPEAHPGSARPHHCHFVDAPFADPQLRIDCVDHSPRGSVA